MARISGLEKVRLVAYDFDGVMTDNRVLLREDGVEAVFCNRGDGHGVNLIRELGIEQLILSTESNPVVLARARKLKIEAVHDTDNKREALAELLADRSLDASQVLFVGNDTNDLEVMQAVGVKVAPADAHPEILVIADIITEAKGGAGVVRELADILRKAHSA